MYRILIVDDESIIRNSMIKTIPWNKYGYQVVGTAVNGCDALKKIKDKKPDVVITDVKMPIMDGIELSKQIKMRYPLTKVIISSAFSNFEYAQKAIDYNVFSYILKPINEEELIGKLKDLYNLLERKKGNVSVEGKQHYMEKEEHLVEYYLSKLINEYSLNVSEYKNALEKIAVKINENSLCVMIFLFEGDQNKKVILDKRLIEKAFYMTGEKNAYYFVDGDQVYIILHSKDNLTQQKVLHFAKRFKFNMENVMKKNVASGWVTAGISNINAGLESLHMLGNEAMELLERRFFHGKGSIITHAKEIRNAKGPNDNNNISHVITNIVLAVTNRSYTSMKNYYQSLCHKLESMNFPNRSVLFMKFIQIYNFIKLSLKENEPDLEMKLEEEVFQIIAQSGTFDELKSNFWKIIVQIYDDFGNIKKLGKDEQLINKLRKYILENYAKELSLNHLSEILYMNPSYLSAIFKEKTGENISDFILSVRMKHAKEMLCSSSKRIQDIASDVGFKDYRYFCTIFKKTTGFTPLQYRLKNCYSKNEVII